MNEPQRSLDDVQDERYRRSGLFGDRWVEEDAARPVRTAAARRTGSAVAAAPVHELVLDGDWRIRRSEPQTDIHTHDLNEWHFPESTSTGLREGWFRRGYDRRDWDIIPVPGSVQSGLVEQGLLADPYFDTNTYDELNDHGTPAEFPWNLRKTRVEQGEWWYATTFDLVDIPGDGPVELAFDGIDYEASVYLNGEPLGASAGMFGGPELDVSGLLDPTGPNELVVRILPAKPTWYGLLKGSPGWGWHYGHLISLGIWRSVRLRRVPPIAVADPFITTTRIDVDRADLELQFDVQNSGLDPRAFDAIVEIGAPDGSTSVWRVPVEAAAGITRWRAAIALPAPLVWWPMGYGDQPVYEYRCGLVDPASSDPVGPQRIGTFGIRTIAMATAPGAEPETDYRWQFVVNDVPLFIKGANWCWNDPMLRPGTDVRPFLQDVADANVQMLRAWGGGIIESQAFYDECDRLGILVLQEFPFSWGPPDSPQTDLAVVDDQVRRVVTDLRNHPSLIMWGGGNENREPEGADEGLLLIGRRCRQYDPSRPYHRCDPWGGSAHNYQVYHRGATIDAGYLSINSVFYGEFGLPSMPNRASAERFLTEESLGEWPPREDDGGVLAHLPQFSLVDFVKGLRYTHYGPIESWDDYIRYSQLAQGDALRFAAERQRAGAVDGRKTGFWFYKISELFPGCSWGVLDFYGVPKASYYRAKQFCRARAVFATYDRLLWTTGDRFETQIFAGNDSPSPWAVGDVTVELYGRDLELLTSRVVPGVELAANRTRSLESLSFDVVPGAEPSLLAVRTADGDADSWYWFNALVKTDRMREIEAFPLRPESGFPAETIPEALELFSTAQPGSLLGFPSTTLAVDIAGSAFTITNTGAVPAFQVRVAGPAAADTMRVSDSEFCLAAGTSRTITVSGVDLDSVTVSGWNAARS